MLSVRECERSGFFIWPSDFQIQDLVIYLKQKKKSASVENGKYKCLNLEEKHFLYKAATAASEDPNIQCDLSVTTTLKPSDLASPNLTAYFVRRRKTLNVEVLNFNVKKLLGQIFSIYCNIVSV